jgi:hypothetical protein
MYVCTYIHTLYTHTHTHTHTQVLGPSHVLVANTKNNIAGIYLKQDKCEEALQAPSLQSLYIYTERERERESARARERARERDMYIYIYIL